jgi:hypothetical protein
MKEETTRRPILDRVALADILVEILPMGNQSVGQDCSQAYADKHFCSLIGHPQSVSG